MEIVKKSYTEVLTKNLAEEDLEVALQCFDIHGQEDIRKISEKHNIEEQSIYCFLNYVGEILAVDKSVETAQKGFKERSLTKKMISCPKKTPKF